MITKLITAERNIPYLTPPKAVSSSIFVKLAASKAGFRRRGVITSSIKELTILPKAHPIITPTAISTTFPLMANSLNSFIKLIIAFFYSRKSKNLFIKSKFFFINYIHRLNKYYLCRIWKVTDKEK